MNPNTNPTPDGPPTDFQTDAAALQAKVDQLEKQTTDYKLLVAELQTSARRLREDAERQRKYAIEPLAKDLLMGLDNLDRSLEAARKAGDNGPLVQGVTATANLFLDTLKRYGVTRIEVAPGSAFDPHLHQAVMEQPTNDFEPGTVVQVLQPGFILHDRVIRPTSVIVAAEPPAGGE
jgi:molecular chaperone GrpE